MNFVINVETEEGLRRRSFACIRDLFGGGLNESLYGLADRRLESAFRVHGSVWPAHDANIVTPKWVYVCESEGAVKIGSTGDLRVRMRTLAARRRAPVSLLGFFWACEMHEHALHDAFERFRLTPRRGDWFAANDHTKALTEDAFRAARRYENALGLLGNTWSPRDHAGAA